MTSIPIFNILDFLNFFSKIFKVEKYSHHNKLERRRSVTIFRIGRDGDRNRNFEDLTL